MFMWFAALTLVVAAVGCNGPDTSTPVGSAGSPVFDSFDWSPKRALQAGESYQFTVTAHATGNGAVFTEWQATNGALSDSAGPTTTWRAVKPGQQLKPGRARVEVRVVAVGGAPGVHKGGTVFLTIGPDGAASLDTFQQDVYSDSTRPTPTPALTPPPAATPVPSPTDQGLVDSTASDAAATAPSPIATASPSPSPALAASAAASPSPSP